MEKILKNELSLRKEAKIVISFALLLFLALSAAFSVFVCSDTQEIVRKQAVRSITNISQLNKESLTKAVENRKKVLETISVRLERRNIEDIDVILEELQDFKEIYEFANMGLLDGNRTLHLLDGSKKSIGDTGFARFVWDEGFHISVSYPPYDESPYMVNAFSYPVYKEGEIQYILLATCRSKDLTARMNISSMENKGYNFLVNDLGEMVIYPQQYEDAPYNALMAYINDTPDIIPDESGDQSFLYNGEGYYAHFEKLEFNGLFLMTFAKEKDVFADAQAILRIVFMAAGVLWSIILTAVLGGLFYLRYNRKKRMQAAFYDELLGIGNVNALNVCYKNMPAEELENMYLVVFDIDKFKDFNYMYGSENGDKLLQYIAQIVREEFPKAYLFRYMSDFFVALHPYEDQEIFEGRLQHLDDRADRDVSAGLVPPFEISAGVRKLHVGEPLRLTFTDAMIARETIKGNYLRHYVFYDGAVREQRLIYMNMEANFPVALQNREFCVYYQPKYDIRTGKIVGAEALARWVKEDGTVVSPGIFIPCFEESYQIILLDEEILTEVCRQMKQMQEEGLTIRPVSVNLSRVHLRQPDILPKIATIIWESGIDPANLSFEITESALLEESIPMKSIIDYLHKLGCRVEMDDYGVGASNPDALLSNRFDMLKLDKSFVDRIGDERAEDLIRSTTYMAMKWGMEILAEGVEERRQAERLVELGCSYAQGFYYSRPVPEEEYKELLRVGASPEKKIWEAPAEGGYFSEDIRALLEGNSLPTYIVDPERFVVMYCNQALRLLVGQDPTGGLCYQKLRGRKEPCRSCSAMRLYRDGDNSPREVVIPGGGYILLQASPLHWKGKEYIQITCVDITRQKQMEEELRLRSREYEVVVRQSITGIMRYDIAADVATVNVNEDLERVEEYLVSDCIRKARNSGMIEEDSLTEGATMMEDIRRGSPSRGYDLRIIPQDGEAGWYRFDYTLVNDDKGNPYRAVITFYDNTEQKEKDLAFQGWNAGLSAFMDEHTIYVGVNLSQDMVEIENRFGSWTSESKGYSFAALMEKIASESISSMDMQEFRNFFNRERLLGLYYAGRREDSLEYRGMLEGRPQWFRVDVQMLSDPSSNDVKASFIFRYVEEEVQERERLKREAEQDSLTGLYNRATTERLIREILEQNAGERCCFLIVDLDDLRGINSFLGHPEGDKALRYIADTMRMKFRKGDILGRIGGDEFVAFLRNVPEAEGLRASILDFMCRVRENSIGPTRDRPIQVSVGGTIGVAGKDDFKTFYERADLAMYYTKATGKNSFNFYSPEMEKREFLYQPHSATGVNWYEEIEIKRLVKAMSAFFPLVISVNLTQNSYRMMEYKPYIAERVEDEGVFDHLVDVGANAFHPEDRPEFLDHFRRENLLKAYEEGKGLVSYRGRQQGADGVYRQVQTVVLFIEERNLGDVCEITFAHVISTDGRKSGRNYIG